MKKLKNAFIGVLVISALAVVSSLVVSRPGKAQVQSPPPVAVYGPPASSIVEILCTDNSGLLYPGNSCTSVLPDGRRGGVYFVPPRTSVVITSVHIQSLDFRADEHHVIEDIILGSPGPNGRIDRANWRPVGGTNVLQYPAGIVLPAGYAPNGYGLRDGEYLLLRGYLSPN